LAFCLASAIFLFIACSPSLGLFSFGCTHGLYFRKIVSPSFRCHGIEHFLVLFRCCALGSRMTLGRCYPQDTSSFRFDLALALSLSFLRGFQLTSAPTPAPRGEPIYTM
jgi:hypothetical protein